MPDQALDTAMKTGTGKAIPRVEVAQDTQIPHTRVIAIGFTMTHHIDHITDPPCTEAHHTAPEIEATHVHTHPTNPHDKIHTGHTCTPVDHKANCITRRAPE